MVVDSTRKANSIRYWFKMITFWENLSHALLQCGIISNKSLTQWLSEKWVQPTVELTVLMGQLLIWAWALLIFISPDKRDGAMSCDVISYIRTTLQRPVEYWLSVSRKKHVMNVYQSPRFCKLILNKFFCVVLLFTWIAIVICWIKSFSSFEVLRFSHIEDWTEFDKLKYFHHFDAVFMTILRLH